MPIGGARCAGLPGVSAAVVVSCVVAFSLALAVCGWVEASEGDETGIIAWARRPDARDRAPASEAPAVDGETPSRIRRRVRLAAVVQRSGDFLPGTRLVFDAQIGSRPRQNLGRDYGEDVPPDRVFVDGYFLKVHLQDSSALSTDFIAGKLEAPFVGAVEPDLLAFDRNVGLTGGYLKSTLYSGRHWTMSERVGAFLLDESPRKKSPLLIAGQLEFETRLGRAVDLGVQASGYRYRSLDPHSSSGRSDPDPVFSAADRAQIGEVFAYSSFSWGRDWPILLYGRVLRNFGPDAAAAGDPADGSAYGVGLEAGSSARLLKLGVGYFRIGLRSVPRQLTDRDFREDLMNREGFVFLASRELGASTTLTLQLFAADRLQGAAGDSGASGLATSPTAGKTAQIGLRFSF